MTEPRPLLKRIPWFPILYFLALALLPAFAVIASMLFAPETLIGVGWALLFLPATALFAALGFVGFLVARRFTNTFVGYLVGTALYFGAPLIFIMVQ